MSYPIQVGSYILDTLQIYFAWDDDLYTYFKERGLGQSGLKSKKLPIIYTDNCESTTGVQKRTRRNVISPEYFGESYERLGWAPTNAKTRPVIPSEKPVVKVRLLSKQDLEFRICPRVDGKEQYHLEYSSMSAFGRTYKNWSIIVLTMRDFHDILTRLEDFFPNISRDFVDVPIHVERKQAQREKLVFVEVATKSYKFSMGEFVYMRKYFEQNGVTGELPSLAFKDEPEYRQLMNPVLKVGFIHTTEDQCFEVRKPQCAMKISQPKTTMTKRGKKGRVKGKIVMSEKSENYFVVPAKEFLISAQGLDQRAPNTE